MITFDNIPIKNAESPKKEDSLVNRKLFAIERFVFKHKRLPLKGEKPHQDICYLDDLFKNKTRKTVSEKMMIRYRSIIKNAF